MEKLKLTAKIRNPKLEHSQKILKNGEIPAEFYGKHTNNAHLKVNSIEFEKVFKKAGESTLVDLVLPDGKNATVLIHDIQRHYLNSNIIHIDFLAVSMTEKLHAKVALEYTGESPAVKALGGVLVKMLSEIEVECLPADLPNKLQADISALKEFSDSLHVKDIRVPANVKIVTPLTEMLAKVQPPRNIEAETEAVPADEKAKIEATLAASQKPAKEETDDAEKSESEKK